MKEAKRIGVDSNESRGRESATFRAAEPSAPSDNAFPGSHGPDPAGVPETKPLGSLPNMRTKSSTRKTRERLDRAVMQKLGVTLQAYFDDVRKEGVPDRFKDLLGQIDARTNGESD
jgi:hypothetical protein